MLGVTYKIINLLLFTLYSTLIPFVKLPAEQLLFLVSAGNIILSLPFFKKENFSKKSQLFYFFRALCCVLAMYCWIEATKAIGVTQLIAVSYLIPILITLIAAMVFTDEHLNYKCFIMIIISFIGAYIILQPDINSYNYYGTIMALIASVLWAIYDLLCKSQTKTENFLRQSLYLSILIACMTAPIVIVSWQTPSVDEWQIIAIMSVIRLLNLSILFLAYSYSPLYVLMPISYMRLPFAVLLGYTLFHQLPALNTVTGVLIIMFASTYIIYQKKIS